MKGDQGQNETTRYCTVDREMRERESRSCGLVLSVRDDYDMRVPHRFISYRWSS